MAKKSGCPVGSRLNPKTKRCVKIGLKIRTGRIDEEAKRMYQGIDDYKKTKKIVETIDPKMQKFIKKHRLDLKEDFTGGQVYFTGTGFDKDRIFKNALMHYIFKKSLYGKDRRLKDLNERIKKEVSNEAYVTPSGLAYRINIENRK